MLRDAVRAGAVRCVVLLPTSSRGLPRCWAVPIGDDEGILATTRMVVEPVGAVVVAALVVKRHALAEHPLDDAVCERIARALAEALLTDLAPN